MQIKEHRHITHKMYSTLCKLIRTRDSGQIKGGRDGRQIHREKEWNQTHPVEVRLAQRNR
jgi:hypothetical protein